MDQLKELVERAGRLPADEWDETLVDLELLLTNALIRYASDRATGRVDPVRMDRNWHVVRRTVDTSELLSTAGIGNMRAWLERADPPHAKFHALRRALRELLTITRAGGWGKIKAGPAVRVGEHHPTVRQLRNRLSFEPSLRVPPPVGDPDELDAELQTVLREFQLRYGLDEDGVLGQQTRSTANVPSRARAQQVALAMERWRWLPEDLGVRHVLVNIAAAEVELVENGTISLRRRAVVGRPHRQTPVFSANMTHVVLNPIWNVPASLASRDLRNPRIFGI